MRTPRPKLVDRVLAFVAEHNGKRTLLSIATACSSDTAGFRRVEKALRELERAKKITIAYDAAWQLAEVCTLVKGEG